MGSTEESAYTDHAISIEVFYILYGLFLLVLIMGCRYSYRGLRAIRNMRRDGTYRRNVLVIGAGEAGNQLIKEINNSRYVKKKKLSV